MTDISADSIRRYLLGEATDAESSAIETEYFRSEGSLDRVAGIEDELVEAFLAGELPPADRDRFERVYLASPVHRQRVDVIRRLGGTHGTTASSRVRETSAWRRLAIAAAVLLAAGGFWWIRAKPDRASVPPAVARAPEPPADRPLQAPRTFAMSLSPLAIRGAGDAPRLVIPPGTEIVTLDLQTDGAAAGPRPTTAVVRTASGADVWEGPAAAPADAAASVLARIEVPAPRLPADDYVITLLYAAPGGEVVERSRYVLRVRDRLPD